MASQLAIERSRRGFLAGILAALATPAIIKTAGLLMPIKPALIVPELVVFGEQSVEAYGFAPRALLTIDMITREAVKTWKHSNAFLRMVDAQYGDMFAAAQAGDVVRIKLPAAA